VILLTFRDLVYRKTRFIVVTLLAAVVFALLFVMIGLVEQFNAEPVDTVAAIGGDSWVIPESITGPFTALSAAPSQAIDAIDADTKSAVVVSRSNLLDDGEPVDVILLGHEIGGLGTPSVVAGRAAAESGELVVDETAGLEIGQQVKIGGIDFTVVGETENITMLAGTPLAFVPLADAQNIVFRSTDLIGAVLVEGEIGAIPAGAKVLTAEEVAADALRPLDASISSIDLVRLLLWAVAAVIIGAVVYLSALERQRDFAVMKAVGVPNSALLGSLGVQAVLVSLAAVAIASIIQLFLVPAFPLPVRVPARAFWQVPVLAVVMALVAGGVGMRKVLRSDPSQAFSGAGV
jgi:putative ABC transport system permease protein